MEQDREVDETGGVDGRVKEGEGMERDTEFNYVLPQNLTLHYLTNGTCVLLFSRNKQLFYVPVVYILKE